MRLLNAKDIVGRGQLAKHAVFSCGILYIRGTETPAVPGHNADPMQERIQIKFCFIQVINMIIVSASGASPQHLFAPGVMEICLVITTLQLIALPMLVTVSHRIIAGGARWISIIEKGSGVMHERHTFVTKLGN